ncbi:RHS repeat-associated core domain-containing protein [Aggregatibacter kilianii]|uniref:RHS repeat domain-containing protein n=1 Tax=Aggregatibacter kilianii TaxID=2025884 RepID=UPI0028D3CEEF|nr:RHS repeat-associated core domain-containing protein [Aggregatibacter kilianii]
MPLLSSWERKQAEPLNPNLLFAGQYTDDESGLAYNRFRYYDPQSGNYLASDPIGLLGGETPYAYVHNPMGWVDPFGLAGCPVKKYEVGAFDDLSKRSVGDGLDIHHVGQKKIMDRLVKGYDPQKAPSIAVPSEGHTRRTSITNDRVSTKDINPRTNKPFDNPRDLIARDIKELRRVYPDIPNSKLQELIQLNKKMYPEMRKIK